MSEDSVVVETKSHGKLPEEADLPTTTLIQSASETSLLQDDHVSLAPYEESSTDLVAEGTSQSSIGNESLQEESQEVYFNSIHSLDESQMSDEMEENEVLLSSSSDVNAKTEDVVDRTDPTYIQLATDAFRLELSKLPLLSSILPDSETEDEFEAESNSFSSVNSVEVIETAKSDQTVLSERAPVPITCKSKVKITKTERRKKFSVDEHRVRRNFVNPLTGSFLRETVEEEDTTEDTVCVEEDLLDKGEVVSDGMAVETESSLEDMDYQAKKKSIAPEDHESIIVDMLRQSTKSNIESIIQVQDLASIVKRQKLMESVEEFLNDIISNAIAVVEQEDGIHNLRKNIDKKSLFREIMKTVQEYMVEDSYRNHLDLTAAKYFRRRNQFGYITPDKTEPDDRFFEARDGLNKLLSDEVVVTEKVQIKEKEVEKEKMELEEVNRVENSKFQELVKNTLKRDGMPRLEEFVDRELRRMQVLGVEMSAVRESLIKQQHTYAVLIEKRNFMEHKGDEFCLADYENLLRQNYHLEKKIEERNGDLNRVIARLHRILHILAHVSQHNGVFARELITKTHNFDVISNENLNLRKDMYKLKLKRTSIQRQMKETGLMSGLKDKPILLRDYDETMERLEEKKKAVHELKEQQRKLEQRISYLGTAYETK